MQKSLILLLALLISVTVFAGDTLIALDPFQNNAEHALQVLADGTLSLDFNDVPISDILQSLAEQANKNLIMPDKVAGNVTLHLRHVTWNDAFNTLLRLKNLTVQQQDNILIVTSNTQAPSTALGSMVIKINYAKAADLAGLLKGANVLSKQGNISADPRTNRLWVQDQLQQLKEARQFITQLDVPVKQVLIKARIVSVNQDCLQELGVKFGTVNTIDSLKMGGLTMNMPIAIPQNGRFNIAIAKLSPNTLLDLELSALESEGRGKVISSPELTTADRTPAFIEAGEEVPYQERTTSGATSVAFKKAVLSLKVVPQIVQPQQLILNLTVNQDKLSSLSVHGVPVIQTREIETQVAVNNGETVVLGGIYEQTQHETVQRIPFLSALPLVGHLFQDRTAQTDHRELLIFVTPQIVG